MKKFTSFFITLFLLVSFYSCETSSWHENKYTSNFIVKNLNGEPIPNTKVYLIRDRDKVVYPFFRKTFNKSTDSVVTDKEGKASMSYTIYTSDSNNEFATFFVKNENFLPTQIAVRMSGNNDFLKDPFELVVDTAATYKVRILRKNATAIANLYFNLEVGLESNFRGNNNYLQLKELELTKIFNVDTTLTFIGYKNKPFSLGCFLSNGTGFFCRSEDVSEKDFKKRDIQLILTK